MSAEPTNFCWRRRWLAKAITGSAAIAAMTATLGIAIALYDFGDFAIDRRIAFAATFLTFSALLAGVAASYTGELLRPRPIVRLTESGLEDRRVSARPIAWSDILGWLPVQNGMQLMLALDVADPSRAPPPHNLVWRLNRWCARRLGYPELAVRITGLDADLFTIIAAIDAFRAVAQMVQASVSPDRN